MATKIYCPRCAWEPAPHDRWECRPGCHAIWNTFETAGRCPGCSKRWLVTVCLACWQASLHEHWYHDETTDADVWSDAVEQDEALVEVGGAGVPGTSRWHGA